MAYATYPTTLPAPRQSGYTESRTQNIIRTTFMNGQIKQRFINTGAPVSVNVSFSFNDKQYGEFLYFVNSKINHGTDWFYLRTLYNYNGTADVRNRLVRIQNGAFSTVLDFYNGVQTWTITCSLDMQNEEMTNVS